ncbi:MAG: DedA family protein [Syntrophorhabdales bacterium]|jgi:membrane protein DedA with SNARE-associated domain
MSAETFIAHYGYLALFIGVFFEGETILIAASFAAHQGYMDTHWVIMTAFLGAVSGDEFYFFLGRLKGKTFLRSRPLWQVRVVKVQNLLERYHRLIIVSFRFLYGLRSVTPFAIGMSDVKVSQFVFLNIIGAFAWSVIVGLFGFLFGTVLENLLRDIRKFDRPVMLTILILWMLGWLGYFLRRQRLKRMAEARLTGQKGTSGKE